MKGSVTLVFFTLILLASWVEAYAKNKGPYRDDRINPVNRGRIQRTSNPQFVRYVPKTSKGPKGNPGKALGLCKMAVTWTLGVIALYILIALLVPLF